MIESKILEVGSILIPELTCKKPMIPFDLNTLKGLTCELMEIASNLVEHIKDRSGIAFLTVHGRYLSANDTLRRGGAHIDGNYMNYVKGEKFKTFGGGGWKLGQNGPYISTQDHKDSYENEKGGIIMASTFQSCRAFSGVFKGTPKRGGDCTHIKLNSGFLLNKNTIYYGNNRMIHESLPVTQNTHRTFIRITLPITHEFEG